eukprot:TRINITY_DN2287_c0_g1_i13.p1 TRINITY_DN2287_c0_g1~~TRINITY_DN2287_c0_g1_i13.p1  ORF type:complete len:153 (+),score=39.23 TRINITY_DN2287_c0_g1_i13:79-537(+)
MSFRTQEALQTALKEETDSLSTNFKNLIESARIRPLDLHVSTSEYTHDESDALSLDMIASTPHDEFVNAINRDRFHSKIYAESMVMSCQQLLSLVLELKLSYSLYDFVSISNEQREVDELLKSQTSANNATLLKLSHEVSQELTKLQGHKNK